MLRLSLTLALAMMTGTAASQVVAAPDEAPPAATDSTTSQQQQPQSQPEEEQPKKKKSNKVTRKLGDALPDCVNLIFYHGCRSGSANQQKVDERQQKQYDEAAERCKQLTTALPASLATKRPADSVPDPNATYSSSKQTQEPTPYCTAEDVVAADHDIDVGDFNLQNKNYRGAEMRYRSALERLPGEPTASLHLARLLEKTGNKAEAAEHYKTYLEWSPTGKEANEAKSALDRLQKELAQK